jgi:hypothetical protein
MPIIDQAVIHHVGLEDGYKAVGAHACPIQQNLPLGRCFGVVEGEMHVEILLARAGWSSRPVREIYQAVALERRLRRARHVGRAWRIVPASPLTPMPAVDAWEQTLAATATQGLTGQNKKKR